MRNLISAVLLALACFVTITGGSVAMQDDSLSIHFLAQLTGQGRRAIDLSSDHADAPLFTVSGVAHGNLYCPPENATKDYVWQIGTNSNDIGSARIRPDLGSLTINWESHWCSSSGVPMQELNFRAQALNGVVVRPFHFEQHLPTGYSSLGLASDQIHLSSPTAQIMTLQNGRVNVIGYVLFEKTGTDMLSVAYNGAVHPVLRVTSAGVVELARQGLPVRTGAGLGMWGVTPPGVRPTLSANPTNAELAAVLASYGLVTLE